MLVLLTALVVRWPVPSMPWSHIDEKAFVNHPLGFFSGDLNPHFFNYPTLQLYLAGAVYFVYWCSGDEELLDFVAWRTYVDAGDILQLARSLTTLMAVATVAATVLIGRHLYGPGWGLVAGALLALAPIHTRFSHLATTDVPSLLWSTLAVLWALRAARDCRRRDLALAALFCGLSAATKYPGAMSASAILVAALLGFPGRRLSVLLLAAAVGVATFACTTPYVWLDWSHAVRDIGNMASEHVAEEHHAASASTLLHVVGHNLRYGLGLATTLLLLAALLWRPRRMTVSEGIVGAAFLAALLFAVGASSAFMRYATPMAPFAVVLACRVPARIGLTMGLPKLLSERPSGRWIRPVLAMLAMGVLAEPAHSAWQQRALLVSVDTRHEARLTLERTMPDGGRIVYYSTRHGRPQLLSPDFIYRRQHRSADSFGLQGVGQMYRRLAARSDLPPLLLTYPPHGVSPIASETGASAVALRLQHPLSRDEDDSDPRRIDWHHRIDAGSPEDAVFDPVDLYFVPIAGFDAVRRSGPGIMLASVSLPRPEPIPSAQAYFRLLADLTDATVQLRARDWDAARQTYDAIVALPYYLPELLSRSDLAGLYYGSGASHYACGDTEGAIDRWTEGVRLSPAEGLMRFNLAAALLAANRYDEAARQSVLLLQRQPGYADGWHNLAVSLHKLGRYAEADAARRQDRASLHDDGLLARWMRRSEGG